MIFLKYAYKVCHAPEIQYNANAAGFLNKGSNMTLSNDAIPHNASTPSFKTTLNVFPWRRFFARHIDLGLFSFLLGIAIALAFPAFAKTKLLSGHFWMSYVLGIIAYFIWIFIETILLITWRTTPGKWLLRIHISTHANNPLTFNLALKRSFLVWFRGMGAAIPLIVMITQITAYYHLKEQGMTSWDRDCNLHVRCEKSTFITTSIMVLAVLAFIFVDLVKPIFQHLPH